MLNSVTDIKCFGMKERNILTVGCKESIQTHTAPYVCMNISRNALVSDNNILQVYIINSGMFHACVVFVVKNKVIPRGCHKSTTM